MPSSRLLIFLFAFLGLLPSTRGRQDFASPSPSSAIRNVASEAASAASKSAPLEAGSIARFSPFRSRVRFIGTEGESPEISETEIGPAPPPAESEPSLTAFLSLSHIPAHQPLRC